MNHNYNDKHKVLAPWQSEFYKRPPHVTKHAERLVQQQQQQQKQQQQQQQQQQKQQQQDDEKSSSTIDLEESLVQAGTHCFVTLLCSSITAVFCRCWILEWIRCRQFGNVHNVAGRFDCCSTRRIRFVLLFYCPLRLSLLFLINERCIELRTLCCSILVGFHDLGRSTFVGETVASNWRHWHCDEFSSFARGLQSIFSVIVYCTPHPSTLFYHSRHWVNSTPGTMIENPMILHW